MAGKFSIAQAIAQADRPVIEFAKECMADLAEQFSLLQQILSKINIHNKAVSIYTSSDVLYAGLEHSIDNYFGRQDELEAMNRFDRDEVNLKTDVTWSVYCDVDQQHFHLRISGLCVETYKYKNEVADATHPLTEAGYQDLLIDISKTLQGFLSPVERIAFFREFSGLQGQQTLGFVLE